MTASNKVPGSPNPRILDDPVNRLALGIFLLGAGLLLVGNQFKIAVVFGGGFAAIGLAAGISGVESVITRRATFVPSQWFGGKTTTYSGVSAMLWGMLFIGMGFLFGLAGLSIAFVPGGWDAVASRLLSGPAGWGGLLLMGGAVGAALGVIRILSGSAMANPEDQTRLMDAGDRLAGALLVGLGLVLGAAGAVLILAPTAGASAVNAWLTRFFTGGR